MLAGAEPAVAQLSYHLEEIPLPPELFEGCDEGEMKCPNGGSCFSILDKNIIAEAQGMNGKGQVVGVILLECTPQHYAFLYLPEADYGLDAGTHFLRSSSPDEATQAFDINDDGIVVGQVETGASADAVIWDLADAEPLEGSAMHSNTVTAWAVNNNDPYVVVGAYRSSEGFIWDSADDPDEFTLLDPVGGWNDSIANDVNESLLVVGQSSGGGQAQGPCGGAPKGDATAWDPNGIELAQPAGFEHPTADPEDETNGAVLGVNDAGSFVGWGFEFVQVEHDCFRRALLWTDTSSTAFNLGGLTGIGVTEPTRAHSINAHGDQVVGERLDLLVSAGAVLWANMSGWQYIELDDVSDGLGTGDSLIVAQDINSHGQICGTVERDHVLGPYKRAFILTRVCDFECDGDTNEDTVVDIQDLIAVILAWSTSGLGTNADVNCDGVVNVEDLVDVITSWGLCPESSASPPLSLQQEITAAGLDWPADWEEFVENIDDENYRCWLDVYLMGTTPNCPGGDPFDD